MNQLKFTYYPDPLLRTRAKKVAFENEPPAEMLKLLADMKQICREREGIGLAAQQVGLVLPALVFGTPEGTDGYKLIGVINPHIVAYTQQDLWIHEEGCLSFPGLYFPVARPTKIVVEGWFDDTEKFEQRKLSDMAARIFLHENDHINGILFIDRADERTRLKIKPELRRIAAQSKKH